MASSSDQAPAATTFPPPEALPTVGGFQLCFGTPRRLPKPERLIGRVVMLDIAFAATSSSKKGGFRRTTRRFIERLGERLAMWVDHHDSVHHVDFAADPRFVLATKAEHGACPEMVTPERVASAGSVQTVVCHTDFDGLASAAKWIRGGIAPYPACDQDAVAADTRIGAFSEQGLRIDRALRARPRDSTLRVAVVELLVDGAPEEHEGWLLVDEACAELAPREAKARELSAQYRALTPELQWLDASACEEEFDRTLLLLLGQERALMVALVLGDTVTFAAAFDSGVNFLERFGLSGGMPTLVSMHRNAALDAFIALGVEAADARVALGEAAAQ